MGQFEVRPSTNGNTSPRGNEIRVYREYGQREWVSIPDGDHEVGFVDSEQWIAYRETLRTRKQKAA